jgi:hypothetical protein
MDKVRVGVREALGLPRNGLESAGETRWPMPVGDFLAGDFLKRADVVLTRKHRDLRSWLIRWATRGNFSHAAMVFLVPAQEQGFDNTFVIEAAGGGVDLTNLADYLNDRRSVVGIKRLNRPWFDNDVQSLVRGRMLNTIKSKYSYATVFSIAGNFFDQLAYGVRQRVVGGARAIANRRARDIPVPNEFICSGLVQLGFVTSIGALARDGKIGAEVLGDVVFQKDLAGVLERTDWSRLSDADRVEVALGIASDYSDVLGAITPEELAQTSKLDWVYVIRDGMVYPAVGEADAARLLDWEPPA